MRRSLPTMIVSVLLWCAAGVCAAGQREAKEPAAVTYRIAGVVVDAQTGAAVPGAELWTTGDVELKTSADAQGRFVFDRLEAGKYPLNATAPGYVKEGLDQHGAFFTGIAVGDGLDSEHVVFKLHRQAVIYGRVTDERGDAVRRATVYLFSDGVDFGKHEVTVRAQMQTNDLGAFRFAHLAPAKYYVGVMTRPWWAQTGFKFPANASTGTADATPAPSDPMFDIVYPLTYFAGTTDDYGAMPLLAKPGDAIEANVQLTAVPAVHVFLTNVDAARRRGEHVSVSAMLRPFGSAGIPVESASLTAVGPKTFEVGALPPGGLKLTVNRGGNGTWDAHAVRLNAVDGESVDLAANTAACTVSGILVAAPGSKPELLGEIVLRNEELDLFSAPVAKDATFRIASVPEGTYEVLVNTRSSGDYVAKVSATSAKVTGKTVKIDATNDVKLTVTMGKGLGRVSGVVKMDDKPAAGVMVLLVPEDVGLPAGEKEELARMDQSDSDGTFTLGGVVPGKYVLLAIEDGWELEWRQEGPLTPYLQKGVTVVLAAGEDKKVAVEGVKKLPADNH